MKAHRLAACATIWAALPAYAQVPRPQDGDRAGIERVLQQSAVDWSRGDLAAFMQSYENAPQTAFVTPGGLVTGYDAIASRYATRYPAGSGHSMGQLAFHLLDARPIDPAYVLVTGRFKLDRTSADGGPATGIFTLLMHRTRLGWRITYDHTS